MGCWVDESASSVQAKMLDAMLAKSKEKIWKIVQFEVRFVS